MAAGLADHVWTVEELLTRQALSSSPTVGSRANPILIVSAQ